MLILSTLFFLLGALVLVAGLFYTAGTIAREAHATRVLEARVRKIDADSSVR